MCVTVVLGVHKTYKVGYRAKTMCHLVAITRSEFLRAIQQYEVEKQWLKDFESHELGLFEREFKRMKNRQKEMMMQQRMKRNFGSEFSMNTSENEMHSPAQEL